MHAQARFDESHLPYQVLAKALFNLLARTDTRMELTTMGLAYSFIRLTKMDDRELNMLCVKVLLNYSAEINDYVSMVLEMNAVRVLVEQVRSKAGGVDFKRICHAEWAPQISLRTTRRPHTCQ